MGDVFRATIEILQGKAMHKALLLAALSLPIGVAATDSSHEDREVEIYSALINHGLDSDVPMLVLAAETTGDPAAIGGHEDAPALVADLGAPAETLDNWQYRNAGAFSIDYALNLNVSYQMLTAQTRAELFAGVEPDVGWTQFFARYAGAPGLLRLSRAGFDDSLSHALVYVEYECGSACGSGRLVHLVHDEGSSWQVLDTGLVWMAE